LNEMIDEQEKRLTAMRNRGRFERFIHEIVKAGRSTGQQRLQRRK
jgi:hypothetical protein